MKMGIRLLAATVVSALLLSLAGCGNTTWVAKNGDDVITSGMYLGYLLDGYNQSISSVTAPNDNYWKSTVEDKNAVDWVKNYAMNCVKEDLAILAKAREYGVVLDADDEADLERVAAYYWPSYQEYYEKNGVGEQSYRELLRVSSIRDKLFQYYYGEDGVEPVSREELFDYLNSDYVKYKMIELSTLDEEGNDLDDEAKAEVKAKADGYLARLQAGESIDALADEYEMEQNPIEDMEEEPAEEETASEETASKEATEEEAAEKTEETTEKGKEPYYASATNRESDVLTEKLFSETEAGVPTVLETDKAYCVVLRLEMDDDDLETYYDTLLMNYKQEAFDELVTAWGNALTISINNASVSRYNPKKLKIDVA